MTSEAINTSTTNQYIFRHCIGLAVKLSRYMSMLNPKYEKYLPGFGLIMHGKFSGSTLHDVIGHNVKFATQTSKTIFFFAKCTSSP